MTHYTVTAVPRALLGVAVLGCPAVWMMSPSHTERSAFTTATIVLEQNFTDQDTEVVIVAKGLDEGLKELTVSTADGTEILSLSAKPVTLGVRERPSGAHLRRG